MTESKYRSTVGIVAVAILLLFAASTFNADPAAGLVRDDESSNAVAPVGDSLQIDRTDDPRPEPGGLKAIGRTDDFEFVATPIGQAKGLAAGPGTKPGFISNCSVDFNDDTVLQFLPYQAIHAVVEWPYWNQYCDGLPDIAISIEPIGAEHYHINYEDHDLRFCLDLGTFGRPVEASDPLSACSEIDPLAEPREAIQPHSVGYAVRVYARNVATGERVPFTMNQLRIVSGNSEVCFVRTDLPWITAAPTDQPAGYCGDLGFGNWDVSATVTDAYEVRIYSRSPDNSFSDIGLATY